MIHHGALYGARRNGQVVYLPSCCFPVKAILGYLCELIARSRSSGVAIRSQAPIARIGQVTGLREDILPNSAYRSYTWREDHVLGFVSLSGYFVDSPSDMY